MKTISPAKLRTLLSENSPLILVDVRTPMEFIEIHVNGAINVPLDELNPRRIQTAGWVAAKQPVYLICRTGTRASKAAEKLTKEGVGQAIVVEGGTLAWEAGGFPVNRGAVTTISLERQVRIVAGSLVLLGTLLGWFVHSAFFGLAAFVGTGLIFAGVTDFCGMGLLLARLPYNKRRPASAR